jgi:hypothetical protein
LKGKVLPAMRLRWLGTALPFMRRICAMALIFLFGLSQWVFCSLGAVFAPLRSLPKFFSTYAAFGKPPWCSLTLTPIPAKALCVALPLWCW